MEYFDQNTQTCRRARLHKLECLFSLQQLLEPSKSSMADLLLPGLEHRRYAVHSPLPPPPPPPPPTHDKCLAAGKSSPQSQRLAYGSLTNFRRFVSV